MTAAARPRHSIRFHSRSFHAMALAPQAPLSEWLAELDAWLERSPGFFAGRPIVLDVSALTLEKSEVVDLTKNLFDRGVQIMGLEGGDPDWREFGMPPPFVAGGRYVNETPKASLEAIAKAIEEPPARTSPTKDLRRRPRPRPRRRARCCWRRRCAPGNISSISAATSSSSAPSHRGPRSSPAAQSMFTARCAGAPSPAPASRARAFSAASSKPNCSPSTAST